MREKAKSVLGQVLLFAMLTATLSVTPLWSLDPINPIKMLAIGVTSSMGAGLLLANWKVLGLGSYKLPFLIIGGFITWQIVVFLISDGDNLQQLFGTNGRNTGLITYLSFSILFVLSVLVSNKGFLKRFLGTSLVVGVASLGYGIVQALGNDPFEWVNPYSPVFGFLGNPNFQSSLLGILGSIVFSQLLSDEVRLSIKSGYFAYMLATFYVIKETDSLQGFLVLLIGSGIAVGIFVIQRSRGAGFLYLGLAFIGFVGVLAGSLNKGPLASLLYQDSVTFRGDYWRAGWNMTIDHPIFGVGLDSYGDWYRRSRDFDATIRTSPNRVSDAAHNVFLDISSYGGFPLLLLYTSLMGLVAISAIKVIKRSQGFNAGFIGLVSGWIGFQAQSVISINQIGLAVWGWVLSGLIIGYEINTRQNETVLQKNSGKNIPRTSKSTPGSLVGMLVGLIIGLLVSPWPYVASVQYKNALETRNPIVIRDSAYIWPYDVSRMTQVALTLNDNKFESQGLQVALDATARFPNDYEVWATLHEMTNASEKQKSDALRQMKRLDPFNPEIK